MITKSLQRGAARGWRASAAKYDGRAGLLVAVMISNLTAVTLFGGGVMLLLVVGTEFTYSLVRPESATWFSSEAGSALAGYGGICFVASVVPIGFTSMINRFYRRRCKTCGR